MATDKTAAGRLNHPARDQVERNAHPGDVADEVAKLKQQSGKHILKFGTGALDRTLMQHHLVDEYRFWLFPVAAGGGQRLFDGIDATHLSLLDTTRFSSGIVVLTYTPK